MASALAARANGAVKRAKDLSKDDDKQASPAKKSKKSDVLELDNDVIHFDYLRNMLDDATDRSIDNSIASSLKTLVESSHRMEAILKEIASNQKESIREMRGSSASNNNAIRFQAHPQLQPRPKQ